MSVSFAPAATHSANETVSVRDMVRAGAYRSWVSINSMEIACKAVDEVAEVVHPETDLSLGEVYRKIADNKAASVARLSAQVSWWDADCTAAARLLWQAANGRAKALGC